MKSGRSSWRYSIRTRGSYGGTGGRRVVERARPHAEFELPAPKTATRGDSLAITNCHAFEAPNGSIKWSSRNRTKFSRRGSRKLADVKVYRWNWRSGRLRGVGYLRQNYSSRNATRGSTRVARNAGIAQESRPVASKVSATAA